MVTYDMSPLAVNGTNGPHRVVISGMDSLAITNGLSLANHVVKDNVGCQLDRDHSTARGDFNDDIRNDTSGPRPNLHTYRKRAKTTN